MAKNDFYLRHFSGRNPVSLSPGDRLMVLRDKDLDLLLPHVHTVGPESTDDCRRCALEELVGLMFVNKMDMTYSTGGSKVNVEAHQFDHLSDYQSSLKDPYGPLGKFAHIN